MAEVRAQVARVQQTVTAAMRSAGSAEADGGGKGEGEGEGEHEQSGIKLEVRVDMDGDGGRGSKETGHPRCDGDDGPEQGKGKKGEGDGEGKDKGKVKGREKGKGKGKGRGRRAGGRGAESDETGSSDESDDDSSSDESSGSDGEWEDEHKGSTTARRLSALVAGLMDPATRDGAFYRGPPHECLCPTSRSAACNEHPPTGLRGLMTGAVTEVKRAAEHPGVAAAMHQSGDGDDDALGAAQRETLTAELQNAAMQAVAALQPHLANLKEEVLTGEQRALPRVVASVREELLPRLAELRTRVQDAMDGAAAEETPSAGEASPGDEEQDKEDNEDGGEEGQ